MLISQQNPMTMQATTSRVPMTKRAVSSQALKLNKCSGKRPLNLLVSPNNHAAKANVPYAADARKMKKKIIYLMGSSRGES